MGGFLSKQFEELVEEDNLQTPVANKKVMELNIDPRSPGITRTPILIAKTPETLNDPRSPTAGIIRTPLVSSDDAASHNCLDDSVSGFNCSLSDVDAHTIQDALYTLPPLNLDEDNCDGTNEQSDVNQVNAEPVRNNANSYDLLRKRNIEKDSSEGHPNLVINCKTKSAAFQIHSDNEEPQKEFQRSPLRIMADGHQRSPLSKRNIDVSSPRHIVQRKQTNKLEMLKSVTSTPRQKSLANSPYKMEAKHEEDKENVSV